MRILAPISLGELIDKITILELKQEYIKDQSKLTNINHELDELNNILANLLIKTPLQDEREALKAVNRELWHIENFKREFNTKTGSAIVEEKSYK